MLESVAVIVAIVHAVQYNNVGANIALAANITNVAYLVAVKEAVQLLLLQQHPIEFESYFL